MIVYSKTKKEFVSEVFNGSIDNQIENLLVREAGLHTTVSQHRSYINSMQFMKNIVDDNEIPDDVGIAIEYVIPQTAKRIDFIITGLNQDQKGSAIVIELKQWDSAEVTDMDGIVKSPINGGMRETNHPSYQAWSYVSLLKDYNKYIQDNNIELKPCAYLHNYIEDNVINDARYKEYTDEAPVFYKKDAQKLQNFIKNYVKSGDKGNLLYLIDNGDIRPSKHLADSLKNMLKGNSEFILIDDQKIAYETCLMFANRSLEAGKSTIIIEGGPGTGKSVVAINLLSQFINQKPRKNARYVTRNSAPRQVYQYKLTGSFTKKEIANLFVGSGSFINSESDTFSALIVDEAHRLNEKSGMFSNLGENQIKEIINAAKCSIFFVDDDQRISLKDVGDKQSIALWATACGSKVINLSLSSQFRCNGSDGYLAWLDNILGVKETANYTFDNNNYFQVIDDPASLHEKIIELNQINKKSRLVAGYCWDWISKNDSTIKDIQIDNYKATWNLSKHGQAWIVQPESVQEVGCIHTCQGLELDYVGVIIGPDLIARNGRIISDYTKRAKTDQSLKGLRKKLLDDKSKYEILADTIIKNTYRTLMTRGMKGCYIYCTDPETQEYFRNKLKANAPVDTQYANVLTGESITID